MLYLTSLIPLSRTAPKLHGHSCNPPFTRHTVPVYLLNRYVLYVCMYSCSMTSVRDNSHETQTANRQQKKKEDSRISLQNPRGGRGMQCDTGIPLVPSQCVTTWLRRAALYGRFNHVPVSRMRPFHGTSHTGPVTGKGVLGRSVWGGSIYGL